MVRSTGIVLAFLLAAAVVQAQQPPRSPAQKVKAPWVVSVVHTVDLHKLMARMREREKARIGVPPSGPQVIFNVATGLVVDNEGHVITRLVHLDPQDKDQKISVTTTDGTALSARLVGVDCASGFAVLQVDSLKVSPPVFAGDSSLTQGLGVNILSVDFVQKTPERNQELHIAPSIKVLQGQIGASSLYSKARGAHTLVSNSLFSRNDSSVVVSSGNQVIGMAQYAGYGRAYLYPISFIRDTVAKRVLEKKDTVASGWLGLTGDSLAELPDAERGALGATSKLGVLVREVVPNSPAATSGILANDIIVGVNDFEIAGSTDLKMLLSSLPEGYTIKLRAIRNKEPLEMSVVLGGRAYSGPMIPLRDREQNSGSPTSQLEQLNKRLEELEAKKKNYRARKDISMRERNEALRELSIEIAQLSETIRELEQRDNSRIYPEVANVPTPLGTTFSAGFVARNLTQQLASHFGAKGVLVTHVIKGSAAERAGIKAGDVIVGTGELEPLTISQLKQVLSTRRGSISLKIIREKQPVIVTINNE